MHIDNNSKVTLRCLVNDEEGRVLDDGTVPFSYRHGCGMVLAGLEQALLGVEAGYAGQVELPPEQAYGQIRPELIFEAVRANLPQDIDLEPGMTLRSGGGPFPLQIVSLTERGAMLDGNHPLAGRTLKFQVEVLDVQAFAGENCASAASCASQCSGQCST